MSVLGTCLAINTRLTRSIGRPYCLGCCRSTSAGLSRRQTTNISSANQKCLWPTKNIFGQPKNIFGQNGLRRPQHSRAKEIERSAAMAATMIGTQIPLNPWGPKICRHVLHTCLDVHLYTCLHTCSCHLEPCTDGRARHITSHRAGQRLCTDMCIGTHMNVYTCVHVYMCTCTHIYTCACE